MFEKETGEIPVRARRREVQFVLCFYSAPQAEDKPLKSSFEKAKHNSTAVEIFFKHNSFVASADLEKRIYF